MIKEHDDFEYAEGWQWAGQMLRTHSKATIRRLARQGGAAFEQGARDKIVMMQTSTSKW